MKQATTQKPFGWLITDWNDWPCDSAPFQS